MSRFRGFDYDSLQSKDLWKFVFGLLFLLISSSIFVIELTERPVSPADGVYHHYVGFWAIMIVTAISASIAIRFIRVPWWTLYVFAIVYVETLVAFSLLWGVPYGLHDSWTHLATIKSEQIDPRINVYPVFHTVIILLATITDLRVEELLMRATILSSAVGVGFLVILAHYFPGDRVTQQSTVLVLLPALPIRFTPRPYTLAVPFILLFYWYVINQSDEKYTKIWRISGIFFIIFVYIHPLIAIVAFLIGVSTYIVNSIRHKSNISWPVLTDSRLVDPIVLIGIGVALIIHLATNQVSQNVIESAFSPSTTGSSVGTDQETIAAMFSSSENFFEGIARLSYVLLLGVTALITILTEFKNRFFSYISNVAILASVFISSLFLMMLFVPRGFGLYRLLRLLPIVITPAIVLAFHRRLHLRTEILTIILVILIITAGLGVAFKSPFTGGVATSGNDQQVTGVAWLVEYQPEDVVGTEMTFWILEAYYGPDVSEELSGKPARGTIVTSARNSSYSWMTPEHSSQTIFVVDTVERQQAKQYASEGDRRPVECLDHFTTNQNRIYMNPDTNMYTLATPRSQNCLPVADQ